MNIYKTWQDVNNDYDTYDAMIVVAESEDAARKMTYTGGVLNYQELFAWCPPEHVKVELLGIAIEGLPEGVIIARFNAG